MRCRMPRGKLGVPRVPLTRRPSAVDLSPQAGRGNGGFIVVAVLWMLGALATLAAIYAVYVINAATGLSVNDDRLKAEALTRRRSSSPPIG